MAVKFCKAFVKILITAVKYLCMAQVNNMAILLLCNLREYGEVFTHFTFQDFSNNAEIPVLTIFPYV